MLANQQKTLSKRNHELAMANAENTKRIEQLEEDLAIMKEYIEAKKREDAEKKRKKKKRRKKHRRHKEKKCSKR